MNASSGSPARHPRIARLGLMWLIGGPLIAFFGVGGSLFWILLPTIGIGQIWVAVAALLLVVYGGITASILRRRARIDGIRRDGLAGVATVLEAEGTGISVNHRPQVRLRLRVEVRGRSPYEVQMREVLPFLGLESLGPQRRVPVFVDRADPASVVIDWSAMQSLFANESSTADTVDQRLEKLEDLYRRSLITEHERNAQRQRMLNQL